MPADQAGYLRNDVLVFSDGVCYNFIGIYGSILIYKSYTARICAALEQWSVIYVTIRFIYILSALSQELQN